MNLLLDTHIFLWYITGDRQLSDKIIAIINDEYNKCFISIASIWEIAIKMSLGKLEIKGGFSIIEDFLENNDFEILPIDLLDTKTLLTLPAHHKDPFDRIIISQAKVGNLFLVSKDDFFREYDVKVLN